MRYEEPKLTKKQLKTKLKKDFKQSVKIFKELIKCFNFKPKYKDNEMLYS